jgi:hypothetical protein
MLRLVVGLVFLTACSADTFVVAPNTDGGADATPTPEAAAPEAGADVSPIDPCPSPTPKRFIFVTSGKYTGDLLGHAGATAHCNDLARNARLPGSNSPGGYQAWVADANFNPTNIQGLPNAQIVVPNPTCDRVADSLAKLSTDGLQRSIDINEFGQSIGGGQCPVWTGTMATATSILVGNDCSDWTKKTTGQQGIVGDCHATTFPEWTDTMSQSCDNTARIYCIQVGL